MRATFLAAGFTTFGPLTAFFLGSLSVLVRTEIGFSQATLGALIASFFGFAALSSTLAGRVTERLGGTESLRLGLALAILALSLMAFAQQVWQVWCALVLAGVGHAFLQVGANLLLASQVPPSRQGLAFGIKQSAIPMATLLAGAAVPLVATQYGWRWVYGAAAILAVAALLSQRRRAAGDRSRLTVPRPLTGAEFTRGELRVLALVGALGAGPANALPSFLVEYGVSTGMGLGISGTLLSVISAAGLVVRISAGRWADVRGPAADLRAVAALLLVGAVGFVALPLAVSFPGTLWFAALFAFAGGWGWPGLLVFIVARQNASTPAASTGILQTGVFVGAVAGPLTIGITIAALGYPLAWRGVAASQFVAVAVLLALHRRKLRTAQARDLPGG